MRILRKQGIKLTVLKGYLEIFTRKWDKAFRSAWNDVVIPCKIEDLHSYSELNYSEIADALEEEKHDWMRLVELSEQQWRQMKILLRMKRNLLTS